MNIFVCLIPKDTRPTAARTLLATLKVYPTDAQQGINCKEPLAWFQLVAAWHAGCHLMLVNVPLDFDNPPALLNNISSARLSPGLSGITTDSTLSTFFSPFLYC